MGIELALASAEQKVRGGIHIRRCTAVGSTASPLQFVLAPVAPPRLWSLMVDRAREAIERGLGTEPITPARMRTAVEQASSGVGKTRAQLIEPHLVLDVQLGFLLFTQQSVHIGLTEGARIYRARGGMPERLHPKAQRPSGLSAGGVFMVEEAVQPGDLYFLGTRDAFSVRSIGNLATILTRPGGGTVQEQCEAVISPCRDFGIGAAIVVLRST